MSENQREEPVVVSKWQSEMSADSQKEGKKERKKKRMKAFVHAGVFTKPKSITKKYITTPIAETVMNPTFLLQSGFL